MGSWTTSAYVDETWMPKDEKDKAEILAMESVHLKSLEAILHMAQMNEYGVVMKL